MSQNIIDTGQAANDGTGEPLRQAFTAINNNFSQIWTSGPVNSNVQITDNRIATLQTNQALVLAPNGIGNVQANSTVVPGVNSVYDLGSSDRRWDTVWTQYIDVAGPTTFNDLTVNGNLTVQGNIIEIGNIVTDSKTIQLANTAANTTAANGSGITVGANDDIATLLYNSTTNSWTTNIGISTAGNITGGNITTGSQVIASGVVQSGTGLFTGGYLSVNGTADLHETDVTGNLTATGNVLANYFIGNGSQLTGLAATYSNANVTALLASYGSNVISTTGNITAGNVLGNIQAPNGNGAIVFNANGILGADAGFNYDAAANTMFVETGSFQGHPETGVQGFYVGVGSYTILGSPILAQLTSDIDSYSQVNLQNINSGNLASGDYIITADNGTDTTYYLDLGLASSNHADPGFFGDTSSVNDGYLYVAAANEAGPSTGGPGNLIVGSTNGVIKMFVGNTAQANVVATVESDKLLVAGNIIPAASNVFSLGNSTNQWNDLYVSNATIYMNNVPISLTAGNVLTVNGQDVVTTNANGIVDLANLAVDNNNIYNTAGQGVVISNFSFIDEAETAYVQIPAGNSASDLSVVQKQGNVRLAANTADWTFDTSGNLTIPNGGYINFVNTGGITQAVNEDLRFTVSDDEEDGWAIQSTVNDGAGNDLTRMQVMYDGVAINTDIPTNNYRWDFRDTGEFDVPKSIRGPVGGNLVISIGDQLGSTTFIDLQTRSYVGDALISNVRIANPDVTVSTASGAYNWSFGGTGNLTLPLSGNLVGATANNNGYLNWFGNSSGDGGGYTTLRLVPDDTREASDQYLIIDPTAPGHIHIRAGGTQDNSSADLFLGGENSYFKVNAGANNEVRISANSHAWVFGADSILTVPGEGVIRSVGDSVTLQSYNVGTGNVQSVYLGSGGGLGFFDQDIGGNWLEIFRSGAEPQIRVPVGLGNLNIQTAQGNTAYDWVFDNTGNLTTPGNITVANVVTANTFVSNAFNVVTAGNLSITSQYGLGFTGTILEDNGTLELIAKGGGAVVAGWDSTYGNGLGNIATINFNEVGGEGIVLRTGNRAATEYNWNFDNTGNLTLPGNTFSVNYANGTPVSLGGGSYGNADVSNFLANYGSNTIVTTGNITGNTAGYTIGYRDIPQVTFSANATAALTDAGKHFYSTTAGNLALTLPDNSSVAFPTGATLTIVVNAAGNVLVNQGTGVTLYQAGASATGNRVVGAYGLASVMKVAANTWVISGTGVY